MKHPVAYILIKLRTCRGSCNMSTLCHLTAYTFHNDSLNRPGTFLVLVKPKFMVLKFKLVLYLSKDILKEEVWDSKV